MFYIAGLSVTVGANRTRQGSLVILQPNRGKYAHHVFLLYPSSKTHWFSSNAESVRSDFYGETAYELLGVSESSTFAEIKVSFHKLAKETHPDLAQSKDDANSSQRFVQILAAYEILSDTVKRAHYDMYLSSQRKLVHSLPSQGTTLHTYNSHVSPHKQMEVVEWLKWYRNVINKILSEKRVVVGTGYFDVLEQDFYSAIHAAYYGPEIESMDFLPDCFEAEERSVYETPEVLHLVSGRDLFGLVCLTNKVAELSYNSNKKLNPSTYMDTVICQPFEDTGICMNSADMEEFKESRMKVRHAENYASDAYKDLELHISGRLVAVATRVPPKGSHDGRQNEDTQDHIHVFLNSDEYPIDVDEGFKKGSFQGDASGTRIPLGTVTGLGTNPEEGSCFVYNSSGFKTHVIMKHRTLMVKHMHWYELGEEVSICECRCSRAHLPPSKFWLFEPRCGMHDIGGWYIETFGRDKKGRTVPSQRHWDGFDTSQQLDKRLHPAIYVLALGYRTLDLEDAKRKKYMIMNILQRPLARILSWCKKLV